MAYYAHAKGGVPFHKREEERRWTEHIKYHKQVLKKTKPLISSKNKVMGHDHMQLKLKRLQMQEDRLVTIDYENRRLLEKIIRVGERPDNQTRNDRFVPGSQEKQQQQYQKQRLEKEAQLKLENERLRGRIEDIEHRVEKEWSKSMGASSQLSKTSSNELNQTADGTRESESESSGIAVEHLLSKETIQENRKLQKELSQIINTLDLDDDVKTTDDQEMHLLKSERRRAIMEAKEALKKENALYKPIETKPRRSKKSKDYEMERIRLENIRINKKLESVRKVKNNFNNKPNKKEKKDDQQNARVQENVRLNKKLTAIQQGKGRTASTKEDYNPMERWWLTSPRVRDRAKFEQEKQKRLEENRLRRENEKENKLKEDEKILQLQQERKKLEEAPAGYHKKLRKKRKGDSANNKENKEELPDTSIVSKNPYNTKPPDPDDEASKNIAENNGDAINTNSHAEESDSENLKR